MTKLNTLLFVLIFFTGINFLQAQEHHDDDGHDHGHDHLKNEVGGAVGVAFDLNEKNTAIGFHLHYMRSFSGKLHKFGVSGGVGFLLGEHKHYTIHLMGIYRPILGWWIGAGPGMTYFEHDSEWGWSGHVETGYEFDAGKIHFGPVIEYAWANGDQHIMLGLHLGVPF